MLSIALSMGPYEEHFGQYREGEGQVAHSYDTLEEFSEGLKELME